MITNNQIYKKLEEIEKLLKVDIKLNKVVDKETKLEFKDRNFHVDSTDWTKIISRNGVKVLESPEKDAWEYLKCEKVPDELVGEQLFAWDVAMALAAKANERVPTDEELTMLLKTKADMPNLVLAGYRDTDGSFYGLSTYGSFWSSLESGGDAWSRYLLSGSATVYRTPDSKESGFSLRCLKD